MSTVISTHDLRKNYGSVRALDGLDLEVSGGEIHGFLGPNGAGKSTTIKILLGLARATSGSVTVYDRDPWTDAVPLHTRMAYVPAGVPLWPTLTGGEAIDLLCRLRGIRNPQAYAARRAHLIDAFSFDPSRKGHTYSTGNRQKVALIAALAVPAGLYLLDEPTSGLDPVMEVVFRRELTEAVAAGSTVLLSSHILSEVEKLCDRVSIIRAGRIVETGTLADLRHLTRTDVAFALEGLDESDLRSLPRSSDLVLDGTRAHFTADSDELVDVLPALAALRVRGLTITPPSLEELFLSHYGDEKPTATPRTRREARLGKASQ
ncbi:ABC transporter ATP-binding protein [Mycetocola manganoxydans]|uniref:ABC transporter ATP-binding protein n=1 Tax=Mycetocola manganoxydans TaxID=699879 RepID=A0A3L6ZVD0_9MICO|nr:ABC transporter ATP-binding protein [Mycetocola manganoxydans]RLP71521.1 ABC transporter ATP-binding protein [Mycetocola manganoxydans]